MNTLFESVRTRASGAALVPLACALLSCGGGLAATPGETAQFAFKGLDVSFQQALDLALTGFNSSSGGSVSTQMGTGTTSGTFSVGGGVDQTTSTTRHMTLNISYMGFSSPIALESGTAHVVFDTTVPLTFNVNLTSIPNGSLDGAIAGPVNMSGDLSGTAMLHIGFSGRIRPVAGSSTQVERIEGETNFTGNVTYEMGSYDVIATR